MSSLSESNRQPVHYEKPRAAGFERVRVKGSHAIYRDADGRVAIVPEHGTIKRGTLASILRQAGLTTAEFLKFLD